MSPFIRQLRNLLGLALLAALGIKMLSLVIDPILAVLAGLFVIALFFSFLFDL
jgi:hypothetical protein